MIVLEEVYGCLAIHCACRNTTRRHFSNRDETVCPSTRNQTELSPPKTPQRDKDRSGNQPQDNTCSVHDDTDDNHDGTLLYR